MKNATLVLVVLGALVWAFFIGRWTAPDGAVPVDGASPASPPATPRAGDPIVAEQHRVPLSLAGVGEPRGTGPEAGKAVVSASAPEDGELTAEDVWGKSPPSDYGVRMAMLNLAQFTHPKKREKTLQGLRFFGQPGTVGEALADRELNPQGLTLAKARRDELHAILLDMREQEKEHAFAMHLLTAKADVAAFKRGNTVIVRVPEGPWDPSNKEQRAALQAEEREFERRHGKVGDDMFWKAYSVPGPRPGTAHRLVYRRSTHPGIFEARDALAALRTRRAEVIKSFLARYGYR